MLYYEDFQESGNESACCILGTDASSKTALCSQLEKLNPGLIAFKHTPSYARRWLKTYRIGSSNEVRPEQVDTRERIFMRVNDHEANTIDDILEDRPVVAVRGRADTILNHSALRAKPMPRNFSTLFPAGMRPDLLVILVASPGAIEARLDSRRQRKTGANSIEYHIRCRDLYEDVAHIAIKHLPVLVYDTSQAQNTPNFIAQNVFLALNGSTYRP